MKSGEISPEAAEGMRYLHPNAEWKTALTGVTYRGYSDHVLAVVDVARAAGSDGTQ